MTSTVPTNQDIPAILANMQASSLFVCDLHPRVNEVMLFKKFTPMGSVKSVKLCRDWTDKSLCYAYINFENPTEAEKAYRELNYELLEGRPMRIMKSTRNPWPQASCCFHSHCCNANTCTPKQNLIDAKSLVEAIETYNMCKMQTMSMQDSGEPKPTGYKYSRDFLKRMNNKQSFTNVFIKNFKDLLDDYELWKLCKPFGEVVSAKVMVDEFGISKGFGFACFRSSDDAQRAVNKLNGLVLDGRSLFAGPAMTRSQRYKDYSWNRGDMPDDHRPDNDWRVTTVSSRICVRNLRDLVDDLRLRKEFERFGPVLHSELLKTHDGESRGTGYVEFKEKTDAAKALNCMNGKVIYGTRISVTYCPLTNETATDTEVDCQTMDSNNQFCNSHIDDNWSKNSYRNLAKFQDASTTTGTSDDGDNNGSRNFLQLRSLASSLADKGHPININDIGNFNNTSVNRNSSNNSDINSSNNAILTPKEPLQKDDPRCLSDDQASIGPHSHAEDLEDNSTGATLSVKNLDESITDEKLENLFTVYGTVLSAKVISNEFSASKGFGFVIMSEAQDAVKAIKDLDGRIVVNRPIYVAPAAPARPQQKR